MLQTTIPVPVVDELHAIAVAPDLPAVWSAFMRAAAQRGFPRACYGLTTGAARRDFGRPDQLTVLHRMPQDWVDAMVEDRLFERSPAVRWARSHVGAIPWTRARPGPSGGRLARLNQLHGVTAGYSLSFEPAALGDRAMICFIGEHDAPQGQANNAWARHHRELEALAQIMHLRVLTLPHDTVGERLNHRHCEVLALIGAGKSVAETAKHISRTPKAVEKRLAEARRILQAGSTAEAVLRAADLNRISVFGQGDTVRAAAE